MYWYIMSNIYNILLFNDSNLFLINGYINIGNIFLMRKHPVDWETDLNNISEVRLYTKMMKVCKCVHSGRKWPKKIVIKNKNAIKLKIR